MHSAILLAHRHYGETRETIKNCGRFKNNSCQKTDRETLSFCLDKVKGLDQQKLPRLKPIGTLPHAGKSK